MCREAAAQNILRVFKWLKLITAKTDECGCPEISLFFSNAFCNISAKRKWIISFVCYIQGLQSIINTVRVFFHYAVFFSQCVSSEAYFHAFKPKLYESKFSKANWCQKHTQRISILMCTTVLFTVYWRFSETEDALKTKMPRNKAMEEIQVDLPSHIFHLKLEKGAVEYAFLTSIPMHRPALVYRNADWVHIYLLVLWNSSPNLL